jgi:DNA-directed RNA polymerase specialized sigma24 family protein
MRSEDVDEDGPGDVRYTADQVRAALGALTDDDHRRLTAVLRHFAPRTDMSEDDLRQEAFVRVLSERTCKVGVNIVSFLAGTIRSIASETPRARKRARENAGLELVYVPEYGVGDVLEPECPTGGLMRSEDVDEDGPGDVRYTADQVRAGAVRQDPHKGLLPKIVFRHVRR